MIEIGYVARDVGAENGVADGVERDLGAFLFDEQRLFHRFALNHVVQSPRQRVAGEFKAVEEALFIEKERAQVTLNSIGDAVLSTDISGNVTYLNHAAESLTGWSREEALRRPVAEVFQIIDGAIGQPLPNSMELAGQQNKTVGLTANCILIRADGLECAIEDSAAPIHDRGGQ